MSAFFTEVQICNKALLRLAANQVSSPNGEVSQLQEDSLEAKLCKANFNLIRDIVLEDRVWSFALRRSVLDTPDPQSPAFGYSNRFLAPPNALNIWRVQWASENSNQNVKTNDPWILEDNYILTDADKIFVHWIERLDSQTIARASNQFVDVLSLRLAIEFCMPLTENATMQQALMQEYQMRLVDASAVDGSQATREIIRANQLKNARNTGL